MRPRLPRFRAFALAAVLARLSTSLLVAQEPPAEVEQGTSGAEIHQTMVFRGEDGEVVHLAPHFVFRSFLGVHTLEMTPELRAHFGVPDDVGIMVSQVVDDSPAAAAGISVGDVLTRIADHEVASSSDLIEGLGSLATGSQADIEVWRDGRMSTVTATLGEARRPNFDVSPLVRRIVERDGHRLEERRIVEIDPERLGEAMLRLRERMDSGEIAQSIERVRSDRMAMESRIRELEARLQQLESELRRLAREDG